MLNWGGRFEISVLLHKLDNLVLLTYKVIKDEIKHGLTQLIKSVKPNIGQIRDNAVHKKVEKTGDYNLRALVNQKLL